MLLDSNILIYAIQPKYAELRDWIEQNAVSASEISLVEVLGYHALTEGDKQDFAALFAVADVLPVSSAIIQKAVFLRQQRKMSLGDSLIAATALLHGVPLVTRNSSDFDWIDVLDVINPIN